MDALAPWKLRAPSFLLGIKKPEKSSEIAKVIFLQTHWLLSPSSECLYIDAAHFGSHHDAVVIYDSYQKGLQIPEGKYFHGDPAYPLCKDILTPCTRTGYHLNDFERDRSEPVDHKELLNLRHARLRKSVEWTFGILTKRFLIIKCNNCHENKQKDICTAASIIHNYLTRRKYEDLGNDPEAKSYSEPADERDVAQGEESDSEQEESGSDQEEELGHSAGK